MPTTKPNTADVLIVGAGPTGLALAIELARRGIAFRLIDIARDATDKSKAIGIQARTLEVFQNWGIACEFTSRGLQGENANIYDGKNRLAHISFAHLESPFPFLLFLPQSETERILLEHLSGLGGQVEREVKLTGFTQDAAGVRATLQQPGGTMETLHTTWIVGCDGAHSTIRHTLGLAFEGSEYPEGFQLGDVHVDWALPNDEAHIFLHDGGIAAIFPLPGGRTRLIFAVPPEQAPLDHTPSLEELQVTMTRYCPLPATLSDPRWTANYRVHQRRVRQLRVRHAFLMGDAAHIHSPAGAQGMNTGIQDAVNLGWKLAAVLQGTAPDSLLDSYHAERAPVHQGILRGTDFMLRMAASRSPLVIAARRILLPLLAKLSPVRRAMTRTMSQIAIGYTHSPLVEDHALHGGPHAGARVLDGALTTQEGAVTLYEVLAGPQHKLLLFTGQSAAQGDDAERALTEIERYATEQWREFAAVHRIGWGETLPYGDPDGTLHRQYDAVEGGVYLVRPDGYIAFRAPLSGATARLRVYLERHFRLASR